MRCGSWWGLWGDSELGSRLRGNDGDFCWGRFGAWIRASLASAASLARVPFAGEGEGGWGMP